MNIAVIAANGRSGQAFVELALEHGYNISAGVLGKSYLKPHDRLTLVPCDATNENDLKNLIINQDTVVSLIGHVKESKPNVQTEAIQKTIKVMRELGVKRLVSLTGTGVRFSGDKITLLDRFLNFGVKIIDPARVKDGQAFVEFLKGTDIDWTVIRVLKLQDVPYKPYTLKENGPTKPFVGRTEVAHAILEVLDNKSFIRRAPIISKP